MNISTSIGNRFSKFFRFSRLQDTVHNQESRQSRTNSVGLSQEQIDLGRTQYYDSYNSYGLSSVNIQFDQFFRAKSDRIAKYREMSYYPDISDALDMISDEAIVEDSEGNILNFSIREEVPSHIEDSLKEYWDIMINDIFDIRTNAWSLFRRWLVDGELYIELVLNDDGDSIVDFKVLPAHTMSPVYDNAELTGFVQRMDATLSTQPTGATAGGTTQYPDGMSAPSGQGFDGATNMETVQEAHFDIHQVVYSSNGVTGRNKLDVRGFLDPCIRIYNQLRHLEDAVVVYRIVRAPERRIWNVNIGRMNKGKAEQYIQGLMQRYRKNVFYDPSTGAMDSAKNFQSMVEDFWFGKDENGNGTSVETLEGGSQLGEITDLKFFEGKLHQLLKVPKNRWGNTEDSSDVYDSGHSGSITRDEIRFSKFINRNQKSFSTLFMDAFLTFLRIRGDIDDKYIDASLFQIDFTESNLWKQYMELELLENRLGILGSIDTYIYKPEINETGAFSMEYVLRKWFKMSDSEYDENKKLVRQEKEAFRALKASVGFSDQQSSNIGGQGGQDDQFGGDMGGGDIGGMDFGGGDMGGGDIGGMDFGAEPVGDVGEFDTGGATDDNSEEMK